MGRKPTGRKYPKHISIQVKDYHNEDLKLFCSYLNDVAPLEEGQWTIRDIILTMLYGQWDSDPNWMIENHFEKLSQQELDNMRLKISEKPKARRSHVSISQPKFSTITNEKKEEKIELSLNKNFADFMSQLNEITGE